MSSSAKKAGWTFLTNHALVLLCIVRDPAARLRDIAEQVGITERAAQRIVADLVAGGYVSRTRTGRRNRYSVDRRAPLRDRVTGGHEVGRLLDVLAPHPQPIASRAAPG